MDCKDCGNHCRVVVVVGSVFVVDDSWISDELSRQRGLTYFWR